MAFVASPVSTRQELSSALLVPLYPGAVVAIEESVVNALAAGEDAPTVKPAGLTRRVLDPGRLQQIFA